MTRRCIFIAFVAVLIIRGSVCRAASGPIIITPGQPLSIHCNLTNTKAEGAKVNWIKDGEDSNILITGAKYEVEENNNTLSIKEAEPDDAGAYECRAKDTSTNPYSQTFSVYFFELEELTKSTFVTVGGNVTLDCLARGKPIPTVQWLKDEQKLNDSKYVYLKNTYQITNAKLLITNITQQDLGNYTCQVFINEEVHKTTTQLIFKIEGQVTGAAETTQPPSSRQLPTSSSDMSTKEEVEGQVTGAAETTQPPSSRQLPTSSSDMSTKEEDASSVAEATTLILVPGRHINLTCNLTNITGAAANIEWFKDGVKLNTDGNAKYTAFENGTLLINKAKRNVDVGIYMCKIEALTKQFSVIFLRWKKMQKSLVVTEAEDIELKCLIEGDPIPKVKWLKDGQELKNDSKYEYKENENRTEKAVLSFKDAQQKDRGMYMCKFFSDKGFYLNNSTTYVRVKSPYVSLYPLGGIALEFAVLAVVIAFFERRQRRAMELANDTNANMMTKF